MDAWSIWITWINYPPTTSHMGGGWEKQIRTDRDIFNTLVKTYGKSLDGKSLHTLLVEVEAIVNSRAMTADIPLSPVNLLTMNSKVISAFSGSFSSAHIYCQERWRRFQHIANKFWSRWCKKVLQILQEQKTCKTWKINFQKGDIVLLKAETHRIHWLVPRMIQTFVDKYGIVRVVRLKPGRQRKTTLSENWFDQ